jgi:hypothetical protein
MKYLMIFFFVSLIMVSCSKEADRISLEQANWMFPINSDTKVQKVTPVDTVYAYSLLEMQLDNNFFEPQMREEIYYIYQCDSAECMVDGKRIQIVYQFSDGVKATRKRLLVNPHTVFKGGQKFNIRIYGRWLYSPVPGAIPDSNAWKQLKSNSIDVEYPIKGRLHSSNAFRTKGLVVKTVNITYTPRVSVNLPPERSIQFHGNWFKYEIDYSMKQISGTEIEIDHKIEGDSLISFSYSGFLENNQTYLFSIKAKWQVKRQGSDVWQACDAQHDETLTFELNTNGKTKNELISDAGVEYSYPVNRQFNFLKGEYNKGYIHFKEAGINNWFKNELPRVIIENVKSGAKLEVKAAYNSVYDMVEYPLDGAGLNNSEVYKVSFVDELDGTLRYGYYFKTSQYNTFKEKWEIVSNAVCKSGWARRTIYDWGVSWNSHAMQKNIMLDGEGFDDAEQFNYLIQYETHVPDSWKSTADWQVFFEPSLQFESKDFNDIKSKYGFPPLRGIWMFNSIPLRLSDSSLNGEIVYPKRSEYVLMWLVQNYFYKYAYDAGVESKKIPESARTDWQQKAALGYTGMPRLWLDFVFQANDVCPLVNVYYVLPGIKIETTVIRDMVFE